MKEIIEMCEERGFTLGRAKRKQAIREIMKDEGVTAEEFDEAWADIKARREEAESREVHDAKKLKCEKFANVKKQKGANVASVRRPKRP